MAHHRELSDEIIECVLPYMENRASISQVCKQWYELERLTRRHVSVPLGYVINPTRLVRRFPNLESLKVKGKPRPAMFDLFPEQWGGFLEQWLDAISGLRRLNSIDFRRGIVSDRDLERIGTVLGNRLSSLKLVHCVGFSTAGLEAITGACTNLSTLVLESCRIKDISGDWLRQLSLNNRSLESLSFWGSTLTMINIVDLEHLTLRCSLKSIKVAGVNLTDLKRFLSNSPALTELHGVELPAEQVDDDEMRLPSQLVSAGFNSMKKVHLPMFLPIGPSLQRLDIRGCASLCHEGHCEIIRRCPNLRILETLNGIQDSGLAIVAQTCKSLKKLWISHDRSQYGHITHNGLMAVARGCPALTALTAYVTDMTNAALTCIGEQLTELEDFRLAVLDGAPTPPDFPLDDGVRALLQSRPNLTRLSLILRPGGLSDAGLGHIGQLGHKLKTLVMTNVGETDEGVSALSRGCPSLKQLELMRCPFTVRGVTMAVRQLVSLRYLWVRHLKPLPIVEHIAEFERMDRPYYIGEVITGDADNDSSWTHILAYYTMDGQRTDTPGFVYFTSWTGNPIARPGLQRTTQRRLIIDD